MKIIENDLLKVIEIINNYVILENQRTKQKVVIENQIKENEN